MINFLLRSDQAIEQTGGCVYFRSRTLRKAKRLAAALTLAGLLVQLNTSAAEADNPPADLRVISTMGPLGAKPPSLAELKHNDAQQLRSDTLTSLGPDGQRGEAAFETVGPASSWAQRAGEPSAVSAATPSHRVARDATAAPTPLYPEPSHTMTAKECRDGLGTDKKFFIKSRFAVCSGASFTQEWVQNNRPVGASTFGFLAIGTVAKGSRTMNVEYRYVQMQATGETGIATFMITPDVAIPQKWPATAATRQGGSIPAAQSFAALKAQADPGFQHNVTVDRGQGDKPDDTVFAVYQPSLKMRVGGGWKMSGALAGKPFFLAPRWDAAQYVSRNGGAAAFSYVVAMPFSTKAGAPERLAAQHIKDAYASPASTKPVNTSKSIPGRSADRPLTRLYPKARRDANRSEAVKVCKKYWGTNYAQGGKECDEFPFSTTYEGAAQALTKYDPQHKAPRNNFSARPIPKADNGAGGRLMADFYRVNRILDGANDGFTIKVS
ncbi:hypothetical protein AB0M68_19390 [Streptomyces sp. NPDC051453]|uniref:NucA/NucB deoxyribonuclease domain-containing protein n=1 Tax=Streptomyces sp. NPDC051453 TaxID=3154941 RepID=UPI003438D98D